MINARGNSNRVIRKYSRENLFNLFKSRTRVNFVEGENPGYFTAEYSQLFNLFYILSVYEITTTLQNIIKISISS